MQNELRINFIKYLKESGIKQVQIAKKMQIHKNSLSNWKSGAYDLSQAKAEQLISIIGGVE